jgi:hypothetical protein
MKKLVLLVSFAMIFGVFAVNAQDQKPATPAKKEAAAPVKKDAAKKAAPKKVVPKKKTTPAKKEVKKDATAPVTK